MALLKTSAVVHQVKAKKKICKCIICSSSWLVVLSDKQETNPWSRFSLMETLNCFNGAWSRSQILGFCFSILFLRTDHKISVGLRSVDFLDQNVLCSQLWLTSLSLSPYDSASSCYKIQRSPNRLRFVWNSWL